MADLVNKTGYGAYLEFGVDLDGFACAVLVVAASFDLPRPKGGLAGPLRRSVAQAPAARHDAYYGEPTSTGLRREGQSSYVRPGTDVYLLGRAWAPGGRPCKESIVALSIGSHTQAARIVGPRRWLAGLGAPQVGAPEPFESVELRYEYCVGGPLEPRNPIGAGIHASAREALGERLPQIEDIRHPLRDWTERPPPAGFGPIARHWLPRRAYAGTYDQAWVAARAPLWPKDLDLRFFHAAAPGLCFAPHLHGGESVGLAGCHPDGDLRFELPRLRLSARTYYRRAAMRTHALRLDAVELDITAGKLQLVWRATVPLPGGVFEHEASVIVEEP